MKPPVPFDYDGPAPDPETPPEPEAPPATNRISDTQDKRFQAMLKAKSLTLEDVFWLVCEDKCPTCEVTRPTKDHLTQLAKLKKLAQNIVSSHAHDYNHPGHTERVGDCDGPLHCIVCAAEEALK